MAHYSFTYDLQDAKVKEAELASLLLRRGKAKNVEFNDDKRYDLKVELPTGCVTIEVKHDMLYERTGNIGVEFESWGKPSGIDVTEADWWCFALHDGFWVIPTAKIKELVAQDVHWRVAVGGDKGSSTKMYLFRGPMLKHFMRRLNGE